MPEYHLSIKADLENIAQLMPLEDNLWKFDVESQSGERREGITFSRSDEMEMEGSKGTAHFIMKWPGEHNQTTIKIVPIKKVDGSYKESGKWIKILALECRGITPIKWIPSVDFSATTTGGFVFGEVDLSDDWAEYDEENDESVSVMNLESRIEKA